MSLETKLTAGMKKSASKMKTASSKRKSVRIERLENGHHIVTDESGEGYPGKRTGHKTLGSALTMAKGCLGGETTGEEDQ